MLEKPQHGVDAGLAATDDDVSVRRPAQPGQFVEREETDTVGDLEVRGVRRRHLGVEERAVDHRGGLDVEALARERVLEVAVARVRAEREVPDATGRQEGVPHDVVEVRTDLGAAGEVVQAAIEAHLVDVAVAQLSRCDAVELRRLVQGHERVGEVPVAAGLGVPIDDHHVGVALGHERVGERHPDGTASHDEVVGRKRCRRHRRRW